MPEKQLYFKAEIDKILSLLENEYDESSYMYKLRQKAKDNRENGNIPSYPPTQAEKKG